LKLDPTFVKAYERKGRCQMMMKQFDKAMATFDAGLKLEPDNQALQNGKREANMKVMGFGVSDEERKM